MNPWPIVKLGDVVQSVDYGFTASATFHGHGPKMLRITDIQNGAVNWSNVPQCDPGGQTFTDKLLSPGDIVFARTGATTGKSFLVRECPENTVFASYLIRVRPGPNLSPAYLAHFFESSDYWSQIRLRARGAAQPGINSTGLKKLDVPLPPLEEQQRISTILDRVAAISQRRERALELGDEFLRATFLKLFGDPAFNPKGFELEEVATLVANDRPGTQSGPFGSALKKHEYTEAGIPVWGIDNVQPNRFVPNAYMFVTNDKYRDLERYSVKDGDILISRAGTVGRMCIARPPVDRSIISTNLVRVSLNPDRMMPEYFVSLFTYLPDRLRGLRANQKENAFTFLNPRTLRAIAIPVPPLTLQQRFKNICQLLSSSHESQQSQLAQATELLGVLSQRAFRGEL